MKTFLLFGLSLTFFISATSQSIPPVIIVQKIADAVEGSSVGRGKFRISLDYPVPVTEDITISFSYLPGGTATPGTDFNLMGLTGGNIVISAGTTEKIIELQAVNDGLIEGPENRGIQLNSANSPSQTYAIDATRNSATVLIIDANAASTTPLQAIASSVINGAEPATQGSFIVKLAGIAAAPWPISVGYVLSGTASTGVDYQSFGQITIPPNTNSIQIPLTIIDDHIIESPENITFTLLYGSATDGGGNAFIFPSDPANERVTLNLGDDDNVPANRVLSIVKTADATEPATPGNFRVSLPGDYRPSTGISLSYSTAGTATPGADYPIPSVTFPPYSNMVNIPVTPNDDALTESDETVILTLSVSFDGNLAAYSVNAANSNATVNITDNDGNLPLRLLSFSGSIQPNGNIVLKWKTADELNTDHFEILYSNNGNHFEPIGKIPAAGSGNHQYSFTSKQTQRSNFYRLHMVDKDGQATYSNIINLRKEQLTFPTIIYPNPAKGQVTLTIGDNKLLHTKAMLVDATGKLRQTIIISDNAQTIPLNNYSPGNYFLKLENGEILKLSIK